VHFFPFRDAADSGGGTLSYGNASSGSAARDSGQYVNVPVHPFALRAPVRVTDPVDTRLSNRVRTDAAAQRLSDRD
jgi:hypothetical protein